MSDRDFERVGGETVYEGRICSVHKDRFRFRADGTEVEREIVRTEGAVAIVVHDDRDVLLVRQPREPIGEPDLLEIPAGRRDKDGEDPLETAKRELAEEIGKAAEHWEELERYHPSVGLLDEEVLVFLATGLSDEHQDSGEDERIEIVRWPLDDLDGAIAATTDSKTKIGLMALRHRRLAGGG